VVFFGHARTSTDKPNDCMITVILSVFNEANNPYLAKILAQFKADDFFELICIDGGSTDGTLTYLKQEKIDVQVLPGSTRAARLNYGLVHARASVVLLQHPRSLIADSGLLLLKENYKTLTWAAFTHQFDVSHFFLKFISWYSNTVRVKKKGIVYLDHCMVINKVALAVKAIPDMAIFEDTALSHDLRSQIHPILLPDIAMTSAIRFLNRGIYKHFLLNQWIKCLYRLKINTQWINYLYERKINLNQNN
jgi:glycosyltransferase involved in cell wall biosynthesis